MTRPSLFHVKKHTLLAVAGCVWLLAGFNVIEEIRRKLHTD